jgi:hypothetical protein
MFDSPFNIAFITRPVDSGRYYSGVIIFSHFVVASVQDRLITGIANDACEEVVGDQQPCGATEIAIHIHVASNPGLRFHVEARFNVSIATARQHGYEYIRDYNLAGY